MRTSAGTEAVRLPGLRLQRCRSCRRMFVAAPGDRICPECERMKDPRQAWGRARPLRMGPWRPLAVSCAVGAAAGLAAAVVAPAWMQRAVWLGFIAGLAYVARG